MLNKKKLPVVRLEPLGLQFEVPTGMSIMQAAVDAGLRWPSICGGRCECTICHVVVLEGIENLDTPRPQELKAMNFVLRRYPEIRLGGVRLACQSQVFGDVTVQKPGVLTVSID